MMRRAGRGGPRCGLEKLVPRDDPGRTVRCDIDPIRCCPGIEIILDAVVADRVAAVYNEDRCPC